MTSETSHISLIDLPKRSEEEDRLGMREHTQALVEFIKGTDTPMTIGIQGEWGSGKTSLMNTVSHELCGEGRPYHAVHVNTWEHSLSGSPEITILSILQAVLLEVRYRGGASEKMEKLKDVVRTLGWGMAKVGAGKAGIDADVVDSLKSTEMESIGALRQMLQNVVIEVAEKTDRKGIIFFIDDLDRLDPTVAVRVLEILKNLFDLKKCVFVLAIDYQVVVKGLRAKFGEMTDQNEWEFRAFFDKIIQLPFSMPVGSYDLSNYLAWLLQHIGYFSEKELSDERRQILAKLASDSIGANPRALKRLGNSISIVSLLGKCRGDAFASRDADSRLIEFGLICCQIAYPRIYMLLQRHPQFTKWGESLVLEETRGQTNTSDDLERVSQSPEFDEPWEEALYRICAPVETLRRNAFRISRLLDSIRRLCATNEGDEALGTRLTELLKNTSVTSVGGDTHVEESGMTKERFLNECRDDEREYFADVIAYCESHTDHVILEWGTKGFSLKDKGKRPIMWMFPQEGANSKANINARTQKLTPEESSQIEAILRANGTDKGWSCRPSKLPLSEIKRIVNLVCGID